MKKNRSRLEIIFDVLKIISEHHNSIKPTPLLRHSNLSPIRFNEYYAELMGKGFIKEMSGENSEDHKYYGKGKYITLTDKGFRYLEKYRLIMGFINEFEL